MSAYDVVVVGAGSAGAVLAARLAQDGSRSVLLLEAGPDYPDFETLPAELKFGYGTGTDITTRSHNWTFYARSTDANPRMLVARGRVTGGTSAINGQVFRRALPEDFDAWVAAGNEKWSFDAVLPYFRRLEHDLDVAGEFHGDAGPTPVVRIPRAAWLPFHQAFFDTCRALGYAADPDQNHPRATGVGPRPFNNLGGIRMSTALCYLGPARSLPNLTVWGGCHAHRIAFDGTRARFVEVERDGVIARVAAGEVVVAAGAIGSPHLLLLSGIGPADELAALGVPVVADLPGVGRNLRDHPVVLVDFAGDGSPYVEWAPRMPIDLRCSVPGSALRNDLQIIPRLLPPNGGGPAVRLHVALQLAAGRGELRLVSREPTVQPLLDYNFLAEDADRARLREAVRLCLRIAAAPGFDAHAGRLLDPAAEDLESDAALDRWLLRRVVTEQHVTSTCKMGPATDPEAVVDQWGRVHGLEGLRVVDGSILPANPRANTNATIMMLAERIAEAMR